MTLDYYLKGLDCPNCAKKIEDTLKGTEGVISSSINFSTSSLHIETDDSIIKNYEHLVNRIVNKLEPHIEVINKNQEVKYVESKTDNYKEEIVIVLGSLLMIIGLFFKYFSHTKTIYENVLVLAYLILGYRVLKKAIQYVFKGFIFDENLLMTVATLGALAIGEVGEATAVMLFYRIGEYLQEKAVKKSRKAIEDLMDIRPDYANIEIDGVLTKVNPETVKIGEKIIVKPGEKIPLDGIVINGQASINMAALTGESLPVFVSDNVEVLSGSINLDGVLMIEVTKVYKESTISKILNLVENATEKKADSENFITKFARWYTPAVIILAFLFFISGVLFITGEWLVWLKRALVFLVISCPCALVISIPLSYFAGIGRASSKGILIKGANYLEALNKVDTIFFDKTGTLTTGILKVKEIKTVKEGKKDEVLKMAALAESFSSHPIAKAVLDAYGKDILRKDLSNLKEYPGRGIEVNYQKSLITVGNALFMQEKNIKYQEGDGLQTIIYVAVNKKFIGYITLEDEIKKDSYLTIEGLNKLGIKEIGVFSGDSKSITKDVANRLKIKTYFGELLPQDKAQLVEEYLNKQNTNRKLIFVGDGINDAPVLALADIGVAMGALGSDTAIEAADVVLMSDEPAKLLEVIDIAKHTSKTVKMNIQIALGVKLFFLILGALGVATMWEAVFADVGVTIIAVINSIKILRK